jgi:hypothetical protein
MGQGMVLPDRIELSTSPLPMECSTTELRQHAPDTRIGPRGPCRAGRSLPQGPLSRKRGRRLKNIENGPLRRPSRPFSGRSVVARSRSHPLAERLRRFGRADHDLEFDHFAGLPPRGVLCDKAARAFNSAGTSLTGLFSPGILKDFVKNSTRSSAKDFETASDGFTMGDEDKGDGQGGASAKNSGKGAKGDRRQDQRQDRLKLALRENLKRRKSQARGRDDPAAPSNTEDPSPYDDGAGKPGK